MGYSGSTSLDIDKLKKSFTKLIEYHDNFSLRYKTFERATRSYTQYYDTTSKVEELKVLDIRNLGAKEGSKELEAKLQKI